MTQKTNHQAKLVKQILRVYAITAWQYKGRVIGILIAVPATMFIFHFLPSLILSGILQRISDGNFVHGQLWNSFGSQLVWYGVACVVGAIFMWRLLIYLVWTLENNVLRDLHKHIFDHLLTLSATFHANRFGGSLVSQASKFANAYIRVADGIIFDISMLILSFVFTALLLWHRAPWVVVLLFSFSAVFILVAILSTRGIRRLNANEAAKSNVQTGFLADAITNVMAIKSFASSAYERQRYGEAVEETRGAANKLMYASIRRETLFSSMTTSLNVGAFIIAIASVVLFKADIATVFLVVSYSSVIGEHLWEFSQRTLKDVNRALGDAEDMAKILNIAPGVKDPLAPEKSRIKKGQISLEHMTFTHPENDDALFNDVNLTIKSGEKIGLVGRSGSGKTSLTKLLLRFNDLDNGQILIDGQNIAAIAQDDLRKSIAYVPQEPLLFHRSIRENIAYGRPESSEKEIKLAAEKANASEFIEKLPKGYETLVGERGVKLSGGQRQRVAIARAILKDAPILVLDEATSALDSESEQLIQSALWELMTGRTAIVIAHRLSTIQKMDRIIVLDEGKIVEEGSHKDLVKKGGIYAQLWAHQSGGFIEE